MTRIETGADAEVIVLGPAARALGLLFMFAAMVEGYGPRCWSLFDWASPVTGCHMARYLLTRHAPLQDGFSQVAAGPRRGCRSGGPYADGRYLWRSSSAAPRHRPSALAAGTRRAGPITTPGHKSGVTS
jgi:hypothetical protein